MICALAFLAAGLGTAARVAAEGPKKPGDQARSQPPPPAAGPQAPPVLPPDSGAVADETWPLTIGEAVRIGLNNCEVLRVRSAVPSGPRPGRTRWGRATTSRRSSPRPAPASTSSGSGPRSWPMSARSSRQYWTLSQQYVQLWAADKAVEARPGVLEREQTPRKAGRGNAADVAEARQRLEQFHLDVVTRTSDVITAERQLRHILGLPPADNRRIVPVSAPVETKLEPDWDALPRGDAREAAGYRPGQGERESARRHGPRRRHGRADLPARPRRSGDTHPAVRPVERHASRAGVGIPPAGDPPGGAFAGPILPRDRRQLQAIPDREAAPGSPRRSGWRPSVRTTTKAGSRSIVTSTPGASTPTRWPRRPSTRPPITSRSSRWRRPRGRCWSTRRSPWPSPAGSHRLPRPCKPSPMEPGDSRARAAAPKQEASGSSISFQVTVKIGSRPWEIRGSLTVGPAGEIDGAKSQSLPQGKP